MEVKMRRQNHVGSPENKISRKSTEETTWHPEKKNKNID